MSIDTKQSAETLRAAGNGVDREIRQILKVRERGSAGRMYKMLSYFMGFLEGDLVRESSGSGKRFRPSLCLLLADAYGVRDSAVPAAIAIELYHNFTLIHDDIEDRDELRRNRPTLWKMWGDNHAINSGDVQSLLAAELCLKAGGMPGVSPELPIRLMDSFIEVLEGQYMDFELSNAKIGSSEMTESIYIEMTRKKSGALVAIAAEAAGLCANQNDDELKKLHTYGMSLGIAYQIADDYRSVWATQAETGKDTNSDIRERKRTLPLITAYAQASEIERDRLHELYSLGRPLAWNEVLEVLAIIDTAAIQDIVLVRIKSEAKKAQMVAGTLTLPKETKEILASLVEYLVPESV